MLKSLKRSVLAGVKGAGLFRHSRDSRWRKDRLLILCYHSFALDDEHRWRPALFMTTEQLASRLAILKNESYNVLPLGEALERLHARSLPPRSVVLTFDDGTYDFYKLVFPLLKKYGFPATVYQTTYYSDLSRPVFNLVCSYMLWKRSGNVLNIGKEIGIEPSLDLRTLSGRLVVMKQILKKAAQEKFTGLQCDEFATRLANLLEIDYQALLDKRTLQLMNPNEIADLAKQGVDFQLHTHRHRTPRDESLFKKEIRDNRIRLRDITGCDPVHFCYPSGVYHREFLPWLLQENVKSATTCDVGFATFHSKPLLLPRFVDTSGTTSLEFESWLTGVGQLLSRRKSEIAD